MNATFAPSALSSGGRAAWRPRLAGTLALLGPGTITTTADNDAADIGTFPIVGAEPGFSLLWIVLLINLSTLATQEMATRKGAATGKGLAALSRERCGVRWTAFAIVFGALVALLPGLPLFPVTVFSQDANGILLVVLVFMTQLASGRILTGNLAGGRAGQAMARTPVGGLIIPTALLSLASALQLLGMQPQSAL